jgi:PleD family two-component response regulator
VELSVTTTVGIAPRKRASVPAVLHYKAAGPGARPVDLLDHSRHAWRHALTVPAASHGAVATVIAFGRDARRCRMTDAQATVFLVDDDEAVLRALRRLLGTAGYEVRSYTSPLRFLAEHDPAAPGCAVLDLSMPDIDGLSTRLRCRPARAWRGAPAC